MSEPGEHLIASTDRHWAAAMTALAAAEGLYIEACRTDGNEQCKGAAKAALMCTMEIIRLNPLQVFHQDWQAMYWAGLLDGAMRVIRQIEKGMRV